jgi:hypothetical protein
MASTPSSSSFLAISSLSFGVKETPGVCSPSLNVVSKNRIFSGKLSEDKATPHFDPVQREIAYVILKLFYPKINKVAACTRSRVKNEE